jgi:hypothetical protein
MAQGSKVKLGGGPMAIVERQLETLSRRDRMLIVGLFVVIASTVMVVGALTLKSFLDDRASRVRDAKYKLEQAMILQAEYLGASDRIELHEAKLREYQGRRMSAYVEELAEKHELSDMLRAVNVQGTPEIVGKVKQTNYTIDLQKADLEPMLGFLYELETGGFPVKVAKADFRTTFVRREIKYNLKLEVVVAALAEG